MDKAHKIKLRKNTVYLRENCDAKDLTDQLYSSNVLTKDEVERIRGKETGGERSWEMLLILICRGPESYRKFIEALRDSTYEFVATKIENTVVTEEDILTFDAANDGPADLQLSKKIVRHIKKDFCSRVRPSQLLSSITFMATDEEEEIRNKQDNTSSHAACLKFLCILEKTPSQEWSSEVSKGLRRLNMTSMADDIVRLSLDTK